MANVTDAAFRRVIASYGKPDVLWTEFVSADGLSSPGREALLRDLLFTEEERPIVGQIFSATPEHCYRAALLLHDLGFDGVDINMGCPDKNVEKQGAGAALMKNPALAREVVRATRRGAGDLPVSVKTRIGYSSDSLDTWLPVLLETELDAVTIHARTRREMSDLPARWETVARAVAIRDHLDSSRRTLIIGNGDVLSRSDGEARARETGADGVMVGRGVFGNPWFFSRDAATPALADRLRVLVEHTRLFVELFRETKSFAVMKKHYKAYVTGFDGAKELRVRLMEAGDADEVSAIVEEFLGDTQRYFQ